MIDLVIFDCDGVLIDSEIISARMLVAELARLGLEIDLTYVERNFLGRSYPVVMETIRRYRPDSFASLEKIADAWETPQRAATIADGFSRGSTPSSCALEMSR